MVNVIVELPNGVTQKDLENFLQTLTRETSKSADKKRSCHNCAHFKPAEDGYYHCAVYSCNCPTQLLHKKPPTGWMPRQT